jgi:hypothetical protein
MAKEPDKFHIEKLDLAVAIIGAIAGYGTGKAEEYYHEKFLGENKGQYRKTVNWTAIFPTVLATGAFGSAADKYSKHKDSFRLMGVASLTFGGGVVVSDLANFFFQKGMLWQRKDFLPPGHLMYEEIPAGTSKQDTYKFYADRMAEATWRGHNDPEVREQAIRIIEENKLDGRDWKGVAEALQNWTKQNVTYVYDGRRVEWFQEAGHTLKNRGGDCDDQEILMASMLMSVGIPVATVYLSQDRKFDAADPNKQDYQHVLCAVRMPDDTLYPVETILKEMKPGEFPYYTGLMITDMGTPDWKLLDVVDVEKKTALGEIKNVSEVTHRFSNIGSHDIIADMPISQYV